jgi:hypothetical protein
MIWGAGELCKQYPVPHFFYDTLSIRTRDNTSNVHPVYLIGGFIHSMTKNVDIDFGVKQGLNRAVSNTMFLCSLTVNL